MFAKKKVPDPFFVYNRPMIRVTRDISIPPSALNMRFVRSSGPGGQNVNKVATACQLRFDVRASALPASVKKRLTSIAGSRMTDDGVLVIDARQYRTQKRNRDDAIERLRNLVRRAAVRPRVRRPTKPTAASIRKRLESKKKRGLVKQMRRRPDENQ
jgi:ribosome-associated protein